MMRLIVFVLLMSTLITNLNAQLKNTLEESSPEKVKKLKIIDPNEEILRNGFFFDGFLQYTSGAVGDSIGGNWPFTGGTFGIRLGHKWYLGNMKVYRPGINVTWLRTQLDLTYGGITLITPFYSVSPLNVGLTNTFSFGGKLGLEVNLNVGFNLTVDDYIYSYIAISAGYLINPVIKFRYKKLAVGLDVCFRKGEYVTGGAPPDASIASTLIGLSIGVKLNKN